MPDNAGIAMLITQSKNEAEIMPMLLSESKPINNKAAEPLTPISEIRTVGITVMAKKVSAIIMNPPKTAVCTPNNLSNK